MKCKLTLSGQSELEVNALDHKEVSSEDFEVPFRSTVFVFVLIFKLLYIINILYGKNNLDGI